MDQETRKQPYATYYLAQAVVDPADPFTYAPYYMLKPQFDETGKRVAPLRGPGPGAPVHFRLAAVVRVARSGRCRTAVELRARPQHVRPCARNA